MVLDIKIKCVSCGKEYIIKDMQFSDDGKLYCGNCVVSMRTASSLRDQTPARPQPSMNRERLIPRREEETVIPQKPAQYKCKACNYKFSIRADRVISKCPYCSSQNIEEIKEKQETWEIEAHDDDDDGASRLIKRFKQN